MHWINWVHETYRKPNAKNRSVIPIKGVIAIQVRAAARQALTSLNSVRKALASLETQIVALNSTAGSTGAGFVSMTTQLQALKTEVAATRAQVQGLRTQLAGANASAAKFNTAANSVAASSRAMGSAQAAAGKSSLLLGSRIKSSAELAMKNASQFQWYSRQLMYNWGLPLLMVGGFATKWAMETEQAMTRVAKVYGNLSMDPTQKKKELDALGRYFEAVSNRYGMLQKDVISIGAAWAAAGAESVGLAKATKLTVETMILGEMSAEDATKSLIAIQEAWRLNAAQLQETIGELNLVENQTAVDMQGLIEAFVRTGSAARISGISTGELAAMIAGIVPAAGNATVAGNSLKTVFSRLATAGSLPGAAKAFELLNINLESTSWRTKTAREQLEQMAAGFSKLDKNQKQSIATTIAGRQQYNRFIQLMDAMIDKNSAYHTALDALRLGKEKVNGVTRTQIQYEQELNQVLSSNPQLMKIAVAQLQNLAIKAIAPMIPYMIALLGYFIEFANWMGSFPPAVKKLIAAFLLFALAISVVSKLIAAFRLLWPVILMLAKSVMKYGKIIFAALTNPWVLAIAAILAIMWLFPEQTQAVINWIVEAWNNLVKYFSDTNNIFGRMIQWLIDAFYALPESVQKAMIAVVQIIQSAAMAVYELFSYLNPFAKHSPSLVENVTRGMAIISKSFASIVNIEGPIARAYASIKKFKDLMGSYRNGKAVDKEFADTLANIKAINPRALSTAKDMIRQIKELQALLDRMQPELDAQQKIVDEWKYALDDANEALREQTVILDALEEEMSFYQDIIDSSKQAISDFASAPLKGMGEMEDQIQANTQAQNELRLAMALMEQEGAGAFDTIAGRMAALNGEFENLTANRDQLVKAGAGSDVLSYYDQQIDAIQQQKDSIYDTADAYQKMGEQLSKLEKESDILNLQKSVNFDPLTYQIDKLANAQEELSYEDIINGIKNAQDTIDQYTPALEEATAAYKEQEAVVYSLKKARDEIQNSYNTESYKLDLIKRKYDAVQGAIDALRKALDEMGGAADSANKKLGKSGAGVGGAGGLGKTGKIDTKKTFGIKDLEKGTAEMIDKLTAAMDKLDLTKPIREAWEKAVAWWVENIQPGLNAVWGIFWSWLVKLGIQIAEWWKPIGEAIGSFLSNLFGDDFQTAWSELVAGIEDFVTRAAPGFKQFWEDIQPVLQQVWVVIQDVAGAIGVIIAVIVKVFLWLWNSIIRPFLSAIGGALGWLMDAFGGLAKFLTGWFSDGSIQEKLKLVGEGLKQFLGGILMVLWSLVSGLLAMILGLITNLAVEIWEVFAGFFPDIATGISDWFSGLMDIPWIKGFVEWVAGAFTWLYDFLLGHSVIPDIINGITGWFTDLVGMAGKPIEMVVNGISGAFNWAWDQIKNTPLGEAAQGVVQGVGDAFSNVWKFISDPFKKTEPEVATAMINVENAATTGATNVTDVFNSPSWQGMSSDISNPFSTAATDSQYSFDSIYNGFDNLGGDLYGSANGTDWKKFTKSVKATWKGLPKDQKKTNKEILKSFVKLAKDIEKKNPQLWEEIKKSMTDPMNGAASDIDGYTTDIKNSVNDLGGTQVPTNWKNLEWGISDPIDGAKNNVKFDIKTMNNSIGDLGANVPKDWKNLRNDIVDPIKDAKDSISKMKFNVSGLTGPLGKIRSAADKVTAALNKMVVAYNRAKDKMGLKDGGSGSTAADNINTYGYRVTRNNATGGSIIGAGGPRDDKILSWLSNGEHVFTSREVDLLGGQAAVYALRSFIRDTNVNAFDLVTAYRNASMFADGGTNGAVPVGIALPSIKRSSTASVTRTVGDDSGKSVNIEHAHFEFPNIKNPSDAKEFLDNLEALL